MRTLDFIADDQRRPYRTVQQEVEKQHKQEQLEKSEAARTETGAREIVVLELYKPHQSTVRFFEEIDKEFVSPILCVDIRLTAHSTSALFTLQDIKTYLHAHIAAKGLVNASDQAYINIGADNVLVTSLGAENVEFMKRDEVLARLLQKMQPWHELRFPGKEPTLESVVVSIGGPHADAHSMSFAGKARFGRSM
jgi:translation initiation factor 2D